MSTVYPRLATTSTTDEGEPPKPPRSIENASQLARVPLVMVETIRWVVWRYEARDGKWTKVPYRSNDLTRKASATDPATWTAYTTALQAYLDNESLDGIGFVLGDNGDGRRFGGIDLDDCIDAAGTLSADAQTTLDLAATYAEISPSRRGIKLFLVGAAPIQSRRRGEVEQYGAGRYFTVTGRRLAGTAPDLADGAAAIEYLSQTVFAAKKKGGAAMAPPFTASTIDDFALIDKAKGAKNGATFSRLWSGNTVDYRGDDSAADLALCNSLAFWTGRDESRMDQLFRQSGLMREKWDRPDYRQRTIAKAIENCRDVYDPGRNGNGATSRATISVATTDSSEIAKQLTDIGLAARFSLQNGWDARYCHPRKSWLLWNGRRWEWDTAGRAVAMAKQTSLAIFGEAQREPDDARRSGLVKFALSSQRRERISAMLALAQPDLAIAVDDLDRDSWLLNCENGTVDLRTGRLRPHRREDFITKMAGAEYHPEADAPIFRDFLARIFRTHPNLIDFLQRAIGYSASGGVREQCLFFCFGRGANGKTTTLSACSYALGDYAAKTDPDLLMARDGAPGHPCNVADLQGTRFAVCSETADGRRFDESRLKDLAGESRLKARLMYGDFFEFPATHKIWMYSNHKPLVRGTDTGFWRRMKMIPFVEIIGPDERDNDLPDKLKTETAGILAWIVAGAVRWYRDGLATPPEVEAATADYRSEMDSIGAFLADSTMEGERLSAYSADLYQSYTQWCESAGEHPLSQRRLGTSLSERGFISARCSYSGRMKWLKIGLKVQPAEGLSANGSGL